LPLAEWWYNTSFHTTIKMTPFMALYGYQPPSITSYLRENGKNGKEVSIIVVFQDDSHVDVNVQLKEAPLMWIGKKWLEFLSN